MTAIAPPLGGLARVNLMPRSEIVRRERDRLIRVWIWIVLGAIVVALLIIAGALTFKFFADQRLAAEQARTNTLLAEIASLSDVSEALTTEAELTDYRQEAASTDIAWVPVLATISSTLPPGTTVTRIDLTAGAAPQGGDPTLEQGLIGEVSFDSPTPLDIVPLIRSLRATEGVFYADGESVTSSQVSEGRYAYVLNLQFDQNVYTSEYAAERGSE